MRILILGGTSEATQLVRELGKVPDLKPMLSLAGRTKAPVLPDGVPCRIGGFGGVEGLGAWLQAEAIDLVVDATHPFAARISANAVAATAQLDVPLISIERPAWKSGPGDRWLSVPDTAAAASLMGQAKFVAQLPSAVALLTMGRLELAEFMQLAGWRLIIRTVDAPEALPPGAELILDRGPFHLDAERALLERSGASVLVTKNSGGAATGAKLQAARERGLPVIMIQRPYKPAGRLAADVDAALVAILEHHRTASERGV